MAAHRRGYYRQTVAEGQGVWTEEEDNSGSFARLRAAFTVSTTLQLRNTRTAPQPEYFLLTANQRRRPRFSNHRLSRTLHQQVDQFQCTIRKWNNDKQRRSKGILGRIDEWDPPPLPELLFVDSGFLNRGKVRIKNIRTSIRAIFPELLPLPLLQLWNHSITAPQTQTALCIQLLICCGSNIRCFQLRELYNPYFLKHNQNI